MEVKNPLFKEDFIQSNSNIAKSESVTSMPPSYSAINSEAGSTLVEEKNGNLVETAKATDPK